jgi:hypothetical protein
VHHSKLQRALRAVGLLGAVVILQACTHLAVEDCGGSVLGDDKPRIRSSHFRMFLADTPAASNRFVAYAEMSALAYAEDANCGTPDPKMSPEERLKLESDLSARGWREVKDVQRVPACEDDVGLLFRVWEHDSDTRDVVIAFRGTEGLKDWLYGNLHWFTRFLPMENQYSRARMAAQRVIDRYADESKKATRFYTTGHSLGGGLAQHVLYSYPLEVVQAFAFDPSSVTGFSDQSPENQVAGCKCRSAELNGEPRIFRIYTAHEILANLRIFHKTLLPPERHIQEVRFPIDSSHSMKNLAFHLQANATSTTQYSVPWYSGKGDYSSNESCTAAFARSQRASCDVAVTKDQWNKCPQ